MAPDLPHESITVWFSQLRDGDPNAAAKLWSRFFDRLVVVARNQMKTVNRRVSDEEDIAAGAMWALCQCADRKILPTIDSRDDLWRLLLTWVRHDVVDHVRMTGSAKRGSNHVRGDSYFRKSNQQSGECDEQGFDQLPDASVTPSTIMEMDEQLAILMARLPDDYLRSVVQRKLEGYTNEEIARLDNVSTRTIERKLNLIRSYWSNPE